METGALERGYRSGKGAVKLVAERGRPNPEELLQRVEAEERYGSRGRLKVFLGYAPGVGKTMRMLDEGRRRKERGQDVVIGASQPELPQDALPLRGCLEEIPLLAMGDSYCMDVAAILTRRPAICLVDGLAFRNPPGSVRQERWQDVEDILIAGVSVITTINLHYICEKQDEVATIRGRRPEVSVPQQFLLQADDIEVVDAPETEGHFSELRQIALVFAAEVVDAQLCRYLRRNGLGVGAGAQERILVCITPRSNAELMITRGKRQAERFHGALYVAYVEQGMPTPSDEAQLRRNLDRARETGAEIVLLHGTDPVEAILQCARERGVTQIFVGHSQRSGWRARLVANPVERLLLAAEGIDIRIFPQGGAVP